MSSHASDFKILSVIHLALIAGQVIFAAVSIGLIGKTDIILNPENDVFFFVVPALALSGLMGSSFMFKRLLEKAAAKNTLSDKLTAYRSAMIVRYALLEAPSLFGIVAYFLTGNLYYMFISGFIILFFFTVRPNLEKAAEELKLDYTQKSQLTN